MICTITNSNNDIIMGLVNSVKTNDSNIDDLALYGTFISPQFNDYLKGQLSESNIKKDFRGKVDIAKINIKDYNKINANTLKRLANSYFKENYSSIKNSVSRMNFDILDGFSSGTAKDTAKTYNARILIEEYRKDLAKPIAARRTPKRIIADTNRIILNTFYDRVSDFIRAIVNDNTNQFSQEVRDIANQYSQILDTIAEKEKYINSCVDRLRDITANRKADNAKAEAIKKEVNAKAHTIKDEVEKDKYLREKREQLEQLKANIESYKSDYDNIFRLYNEEMKALSSLSTNRYALSQTLIAKGTENYREAEHKKRLLNYANLVLKTRTDPDAWYFQVFHTKDITSIIKEFSKVDDLEEFLEQEEDNPNFLGDKYNSDTIDETTKSWEDSMYKNFNQAINGKLRVILSTVPKLSQPFNETSDVQPIDTNNDLGVPQYMDAQFLTTQMFNNVDTSSVEAMIASLEKKAKNINTLYGLGQLVDMMKKDNVFANYVFANFAKPVVRKSMLTVDNISDDATIRFEYSNNSAMPLTELVFRITNRLRAIYNSVYGNHATELNTLAGEIYRNGVNEATIEKLMKIVNVYLPTIPTSAFENFFKSNDNKANSALVTNIMYIISGVNRYRTRVNNAIKANSENNNKIYNEYIKEARAAQREGRKMPKLPVYTNIDFSDYDFDATTYSNIITLARNLTQYTDGHIRLNNSNAEGNSSSDVMKNCYVTRFFDLVDLETNEDKNAGLKSLLDYFKQGTENGGINQYIYNPLLFGVYNEDGIRVVDGLFDKDIPGFEVNANAKQMIRYSLFDGSKNTQDSKGLGYDKMSKLDFFITQFIAFRNSIEEITEKGKTSKAGNIDTAVYSMRIGSDAPKIFFIRAPRYNDTNVKHAIYQNLLGELNMFLIGMKNLFIEDGGIIKTRTDVTNLFGRAFFDEGTVEELKNKGAKDFTSAIVKNGKLVGKLFQFNRLFDLTSRKKEEQAGEQIASILSLYGQNGVFNVDGDGRIVFNENNGTIVCEKDSNGNIIGFKLNLSDGQKENLRTIVDKWIADYYAECKSKASGFIDVLKANSIKYSDRELYSYFLNYANMNMIYDDLFEGDYSFYGKPRDFLKRTKEVQAGGDGYAGYDTLKQTTKNVEVIKKNGKDVYITIPGKADAANNTSPVEEIVSINGRRLTARDGFRGVTIYNTTTTSYLASQIKENIEKNLIEEGFSKEVAEERATKIAKYYGYGSSPVSTAVNDAQSYITIDEFIRRRYADGTINEYADLIRQLTDDSIPADKINIDDVAARIQVQKNFYYDKVYDAGTGLFVPRQIKNAEFVIIPKLLPKDSQLRQVYDWMVANGIDQLNTAETSKASKKNIFTIWDSKTGEFKEDFANDFRPEIIENYSYQYLYKQQEVPQHMMDEKNKAGSQITKIVPNNLINEVESKDENRNRLIKAAREYHDAYTYNIEESFYAFLDNMGWAIDTESGKVINANYATTDANGNKLSDEEIESNKTQLNFSVFLARGREEAARLGMDSNFIDYLIPNEFGVPNMPNWMNVAATKLESIAQAIYNKRVTRQTFPGWHAAQITGVGYSSKLRLDVEKGIMEVYLPRWSKLIPKGKTEEENREILEQIEKEGLDIHLGYRIPTEGKQSISILRVVGFTHDCLGSTIVVPNEWIIQTGSDFDVDSIYGICWEMYATKNKKGRIELHKIPYENVEDEVLYVRYVNQRIEDKIIRNDLGEEINSKVKEIRDKLNSVDARKSYSESYKELDRQRNELYTKLPSGAKRIIIKTNEKHRTIVEDNSKKVNVREAYPDINQQFEDFLEEYKNTLNDEAKRNIERYIVLQQALIDVINEQDGLPAFNKDEYKEEKNKAITDLVKKARAEYLQNIEKAAKEAGLLSYEEFKKLPYVNKLDRRARNNYILDRLIMIVEDKTSREEQYGRSQFDAIINDEKTGANDVIDDISGETSRNRSPYNPMDQLDYYEDTMSGRRLKAQSVNWDRFASINNWVRAELSDNDAVDVILTLSSEEAADVNVLQHSKIKYNEDGLRRSYGNDIQEYDASKRNNVRVLKDEFKNAIPIQMKFPYDGNNRGDVKSKTTIDAIINGERTATTRYEDDRFILNYKDRLKVGTIVKFHGNGKVAYARITKAPYRLQDAGITAEEWSKLEGWSVNYYNSNVKHKQSIAWQYQFEFIPDDEIYESTNSSTGSQQQANVVGVGDDIKTYTLNTGSQHDGSLTKGGDSIWYEIAKDYGITNINAYAPSDVDKLSKEEQDEVEDAYKKATDELKRNYYNKNEVAKDGSGRPLGGLVRRDYLQVVNSDAVFAVATINVNTQTVNGGTGYAVQMGIDLGKPVHVLNMTDRKWYTYNKETKKFVEEKYIPILTKKFAGVGSRTAEEQRDWIVDEIRKVFELTKNGSNEKIEKDIRENIGVDTFKTTIKTLNSDNDELSKEEKTIVRKELGFKPKVLVASESTDPVWHYRFIKDMVNRELAKPRGQRDFQMLYLITKHDGIPFRELAELKIPKLIHFSITSLGGSKYEPGVMKMDDLLDRIEIFIKEGVIIKDNVTIRIDPIIPGVTNKEDIRHIIERGTSMGIRNYKFSLMDSYDGSKEDRHIVEKLTELGYDWKKYYGFDKHNKYKFNPKQEYIEEYYSFMDDLAGEFNIFINTCGENFNLKLNHIRTNMGCINVDAMNKAMGTTNIVNVEGHQRKDCSCYGKKSDVVNLFDKNFACASSCVYCYAKHNSDKYVQYYNADGTLKDNNYTRTAAAIDEQKQPEERVEFDNKKGNTRKQVKFKARKFGWSNDNRNSVGEYTTTYGSQTTAHHLDAVKRGSIPNVNEYTFSVYKFLVELGIDYETIISFIRQPAIANIIDNNNLINSVFLNSHNDPIKMTIADIGTRLELTDGKNEITKDSYIGEVFAALRGDYTFVNTFNNMFGINISMMTDKSIMDIKLPLDKLRLFTRIMREARNANPTNSKTKYENAAFDLGVILTFRNIKVSAEKVNALIMASNADNYGAMPSIRETRKMVNRVNELRDDNSLSKDDVSFMNLVFPIDETTGEVDVNNSKYKPLAAFYNYVTLRSLETNTKFFNTENEDFARAEDVVQKAIRHKMSDAEYKEYKRYAIATLYNTVQKLLTPLTVDKIGRVNYYTEQEESDGKTAENKPNYWDEERTRIYGYNVTTDGDFDIADVNNPTKEDIDKFIKLTPAQKVLFIQKHFADNPGLFEYIKVTLFNNTDIKYKGVNRQYLSYDDQTVNSEDMYKMFRDVYNNNNPLIKLAAIDLIKYSFIAEGFNYKSGYISKIIPNMVLYTNDFFGGFNIINSPNDINNSLKDLIDELPGTIRDEEFITNYVRSHSEIVRLKRMPTLGPRNVSNTFLNCFSNDGLGHLTINSSINGVRKVLDKLNLENVIYASNSERGVGFIRINFPLKSNGFGNEDRRTVLFKVVGVNKEQIGLESDDNVEKGYTDFFLIPLNLLDRYETYDYSYNNNYNNYNSLEYYEEAIKNILNNKYTAVYNPVKNYFVNNNIASNPNGLMSLYYGGNDYIKGSVRKLINDYFDNVEQMKGQHGLNPVPITLINNFPALGDIIPAGATIRQTIENEDGSLSADVEIQHVKKTPKVIKSVNDILAGNIKREGFDSVVNDINNNGLTPANCQFYTITVAPKDADTTIRKASTTLVADPDVEEGLSMPTIPLEEENTLDNVSFSMFNEINYNARHNNSSIAKSCIKDVISKGINRNSIYSLSKHRKDVYASAARYYLSAANSIINRFNNFEMINEDGTVSTYKMDSKEFYEALAKNDKYFGEVSKLLLDAITFGNRIADIRNADATFEDDKIKNAVETIKRAIDSVKTERLNTAMKYLFDIYFKKYSTNPDIADGLINLRETYGDIDWATMWFANAADIPNNQTQVILKQVYGMFNKAEMFDARRNVKEWKDALAKIEAMPGELDINKVIDFDRFTLRPDFTEQFVKERQKVIDDLNKAKIALDEAKTKLDDTKESKDAYFQAFKNCVKARYYRDRFMFANTNQPIVDDYYRTKLDAEYTAMEYAGDDYFRYLMLTDMLRNINNDVDPNDEEYKRRKQNLIIDINELKSNLDRNGELKDDEGQFRAAKLTDYIRTMGELWDTYFKTKEYEGFRETYEKYSKVIAKYDRDTTKTIEEKLTNPEYREAYDWIKDNGRIVFAKEQRDKLKDAFRALTNRDTVISKSIMAKLKSVPGVVDENGNINPLNLNDEQIKELRESELRDADVFEEEGMEFSLIKFPYPGNTKPPIDINASFYKRDMTKPENLTIGQVTKQINDILKKTIDRNTGAIRIQDLFDDNIVTSEERDKLIECYDKLEEIDKEIEANRGKFNTKDKKDSDSSYERVINRDAFNQAKAWAAINLRRDTKEYKQYIRIFRRYAANGALLEPNFYLFGYKVPKGDAIDTIKTEARNYIDKNVEFVEIPEYWVAARRAAEKGIDAEIEWFENNHIYDVYNHKYRPLRIWTRLTAIPGSELAESIEYIPTFDNMERSVKDEYVNKEYNEFNGYNYRRTNGEYNSDIKLNAKEAALKDLIKQVLNKHASTYQGKRFIGQGYLPRERKTPVTTRWAAEQALSLVGFSYYSGTESDSFRKEVDYTHDKEADMDMLSLMKVKGTRKYLRMPERSSMDSNSDYEREVIRIKEENRKIKAENEKLDNMNINKDWKEVMEHFIHNASIFNARQAAKPYLYLLLEDLAINKAYRVEGMWDERLVRASSPIDKSNYATTPLNNTRQIVHNLARRLLYDEYHKKNTARAIANFLQNFASAKYMIFNLYGGVANVTTGKVNIAMEEFANEYFGFDEFRRAQGQYLKTLPEFIATMYSDKAKTLTGAFIKLFNVVDFDQILQYGSASDNLNNVIKNIRNHLYDFQSMGEHYMQNSVLLAMLKSNRLYTDADGVQRIGDFNEYTKDIEKIAMRMAVNSNQIVKDYYEMYLAKTRSDVKEKLQLTTGRKDINRGFLLSLRNSDNDSLQKVYKDVARAYSDNRNKLLKDAKVEFNKNATIESLFEFKDGEAVLKQSVVNAFNKRNSIGSLENLLGQFRQKVIITNQKIHGVYDKNGAAMLESTAFGSLFMQYKKHLPTGISKRLRRHGYYSEFRGSKERGTYQALADFLNIEFLDFKSRVNNRMQNGENVTLASLQVAMQSAINLILNIGFDYKHLTSKWEKRNMRRSLGELSGIIVAAAVVVALYGLYDDDDIKDDTFKASLMYLSDRLYNETTMYTPFGAWSEVKTMYSNPVAAGTGPADMVKLMTMLAQYGLDPDFDSTYDSGVYAGENKFEILLKRNAPGIRPWERIRLIVRNNEYYKVGETEIGMNIAKHVGKSIHE